MYVPQTKDAGSDPFSLHFWKVVKRWRKTWRSSERRRRKNKTERKRKGLDDRDFFVSISEPLRHRRTREVTGFIMNSEFFPLLLYLLSLWWTFKKSRRRRRNLSEGPYGYDVQKVVLRDTVKKFFIQNNRELRSFQIFFPPFIILYISLDLR